MFKRSKKLTLYPYWLSFPALVIYSIVYIVPLVAVLFLSVTDWNARDFWSPKFIGIENIVSFFNDKNFAIAFKNTLVFAIVTTVFKTVLGFLLALALIRPLKTRNLIRMVYFIPAVLNSIVVGLVFSSMFRMNGLFTQVLSSVGIQAANIDWLGNPKLSFPIIMFTEIWQWSGYSMVIFIAGMQSIPRELYEAASIDGASSFQQLKNITIPLLTTSFNFCITIALIGGFKVFAPVYVLTNGGPGFETDVLARFTLTTFNAGFYGKSSAISLVQSVLIIIISLSLNSFMKKREVEL